MVTQETCPALVDFDLMWAGVSEAAYDFAFVRHRPRRDSLRLTIAGVGEAWVDGRWQPCEPGSAYLTPSGHLHAYRAVRGKPWTLCWMTFAESSARRVVTVDQPVLRNIDPRSVYAAVLGVHAETSGRGDPVLTRRWLELLSLSVMQAVTSGQPADRLWPLWAEVEGQLARPWTRDDLAAISDMSGENLRLICQRQYGRSPLQQLTHLRMLRAVSLLRATSYKVSVIAKAVGYSDAFSFSTAFRRWAGSSPAKYRKQGASV